MARNLFIRCTGALALLILAGAIADHAKAGLRMCAFRDGPRGPCTCKSDTNAPGQWTIANRSKCQRKTVEPTEKKEAAGTTVAKEEGDRTIETGATSAPSNEPSPAQADPNAVERSPTQADPKLAPIPGAGAIMDVGAIDPMALPGGSGRKLKEVRARGKLNCGVSTGLLGFSSQTQSGEWRGIDADFCRAVAAAVFGDPAKVEFIPLEAEGRFEALKSDKIDVLSRNTTWTMDRDVDEGAEFVGVLYFDGQSFMAKESLGLVSAQQLEGYTVCVESPTTSEANLAFYLKSQGIATETKTFKMRDELIKAYVDGTCDVITGDRSALFSERAKLAEPLENVVLPEIISKEPLGPAVRNDDVNWAEVVRWTLAGLINAEEVGLNKVSAADTQPPNDGAQRLLDGAGNTGTKMQLNRTWLKDTIASVGNYGEMFEANVGNNSPLGMNRGLNALWKRGGILYAPPMW